MYPSTHSARHPAQTLSLNNQYIPSPYDFTGYHHVGDPSTGTWNPAYAPREEWSPYAYSFPGSSPGAGQVSFTSPDLSGTPTAAGGGSFPAYSFLSGHDPLNPRRKTYEPDRPAGAGMNGLFYLILSYGQREEVSTTGPVCCMLIDAP